MDLTEFREAMEAECGSSSAGTWHIVDETLTGWSQKAFRPWIIVDDPGSGPNVQMVPRSTKIRRGAKFLPHESHQHGPLDTDRTSCRINEPGTICAAQRRPIHRKWIAGPRSYSCREPDDAILQALGCQR